MVIVKILGGLGNQMFSYACGRALAEKHNTELLLDLSEYTDYSRPYMLDQFNIHYTVEAVEYKTTIKIIKYLGIWLKRIFGTARFCSINGIKPVWEKKSTFDQNILTLSQNVYLQGYWGSEKYFESIKNIIKEEYTLKKELSANSKKWKKVILNNSSSVSLHIRRGDYVNVPANKKIFVSLDVEYYQRAVEYLKKIAKIEVIFIFSNDIEWCKNMLAFDLPVYYVEGNNEDHGYEDMYLMSLCHHNVIANSTFSWWGAWLNSHDDKIVIYPDKFFYDVDKWHDTSDLCPDSWVCMSI